MSNSLVNNGSITASKVVSSLEYDVLGQLKTKLLGTQGGGPGPLERQVYDYNIRGWLLGMNRVYARDISNTSPAIFSGETFTSPPPYTAGNYFGYDLGYDQSENNMPGTNHVYTNPQYNGNISGTVWKSAHDGQVRKYDFAYDPVNRLLGANFNQYTSTGFNVSSGVDYSVSNLSYDANGNILSMTQSGLKPNATRSEPIDILNYTYISGSNKLLQVVDAVNDNTSTLGDFKYDQASKTGTDYTYNTNGSLYSDKNKKISHILYNHLNLPQEIAVTGKGTINYVYDAGGNKLQKRTYDNATGLTTVTTYIGGNVYQNDVLQFIPHEEGRIRVNNSSNGYIFDYFLKDHLGNIRMTLTEDNTVSNPVIDATSFYPFGLTMSIISTPPATGKLINKFKYNGKELQNQEFSDKSGLEEYDYGARFYDAQIGRWQCPDPLSEVSRRWSLYNYCYNNPIKFIDPDGMEGVDVGSVTTLFGKEALKLLNQLKDQAEEEVDDNKKKDGKKENKDNKENTKGKTSTLSKVTKVIQATVIALAVDDATGIGVIDDVAIPVLEAVNGALWLYDVISGGSTVPDASESMAPATPSYTPSFVRNNSVATGDYSQQPPGGLTKLKNGQGWRDSEGNIWKKDQLHKDHWDITNPKTGKKVKEIDFGGKQIWPGGPKNKNK